MASSRLDMSNWTKTSNGMTLAQAFGVDKGAIELTKLTAKLPAAQSAAGGSASKQSGNSGSAGGVGKSAKGAAKAAAGSGVVTGSGGSPSANRALGQQMAAQVGWTGAQWVALNNVVMAESGWVTNINNGGFRGPPQPGRAYGIPQALPANKMASAGADWATNPKTQIRWMLGYIRSVYGTPEAAWNHELRFHWY